MAAEGSRFEPIGLLCLMRYAAEIQVSTPRFEFAHASYGKGAFAKGTLEKSKLLKF